MVYILKNLNLRKFFISFMICFIKVNRHYMHKMIKSHCIFNNFLYLQQYICILFLITRKGGFICIPITHT